MSISRATLRSAEARSGRMGLAKSLSEAVRRGQQTAFLCHSHKDSDLAKGLAVFLSENGWDVYVDWQDNDMPQVPDGTTAERIREKIKEHDWFLFLATPNSVTSRWCPWEIGIADGRKPIDRIVVVPTSSESGETSGNEYLQLYRYIWEAEGGGFGLFGPRGKGGGMRLEGVR